MSSINTNAGAMTALQTLKATNKAMDATQNRVATGFRVSEASHNAAYWSLATTMRSDNNAMSTVQDALGLGAAQVDVAYTAMDVVKDTLDTMKSKLVAASQPGVDKTKIQAEIAQLQKDLQTYAKSATFSGGNWLDVEKTDNQQVVASFVRGTGNAVSLQTIDVDTADIALFVNDTANPTAKGLLQGVADLTVPAEAGELPDVSALTGTVNVADGTDDDVTIAGFGDLTWAEGNTVTFNVDIDGTETEITGTFDGTAWTFDGTPADTTISVTGSDLVVNYDNSTGSAVDVTVGGFAAQASAAPSTGPDVSGLVDGSETAASGSDTIVTIAGAGDIEWAAGDTFSFDVTTGASGDTTTITGSYDGTDWTWADAPTGVTVAFNGSDLEVTAADGTVADTEDFEVGNFAATSEAEGPTVTDFDITDMSTAQIGKLISHVDEVLGKVTSAASELGAIKSRIDSQSSFVGKIMDAVDRGIGQLVDADMTEESSRLQALQVQQQLGIQALSMANSNSQVILSLFR